MLLFSGFFNIVFLAGVCMLGFRKIFEPPMGTILILFCIYFGAVAENLTEVLVLNPPKNFQSSDRSSQDEKMAKISGTLPTEKSSVNALDIGEGDE